MGNLQEFLTFINKETNRPMRSADLGPVPPRPKAGKPSDPLAAYKISQQAKKKAEQEAAASNRMTSMVQRVRATHPKSDEVPM